MERILKFNLPDHRLNFNRQKNGQRKIILFTYLPQWLEVCLPIAAVLGQLGYQVDLVFLPYDKTHLAESWYKTIYDRYSYGQLEKINLPGVQISMLSNSNIALNEEEEKQATEQAKLDVSYILKTGSCDLDQLSHQKAFEFRLMRNRAAISALKEYLVNKDYDVLIVPNGVVLEYGAAYRLAKLHDLSTVTFEYMVRPGSIVISNDSPVVDLNLDKAWAAYKESVSDGEALSSAISLIEERSKAENRGLKGYYQSIEPQVKEEIFSLLKLSTKKKTALLCTNVVWDSASLGRDLCFSSYREWLEQTVNWFANHSDWQLIVRVHPAEQMIGTAEPVADIVNKALPKDIHNIALVNAEDKINTYSIAALSDLGIVHTSTIGIEFAVLGIPTICTGRAHYRAKGFTIDPENSESYFNILENADIVLLKMRAANNQSRAANYFDFYFNFWPIPFNWQIGNMAACINEWPIEKQFSEEGLSKYGHVWPLFANDNHINEVNFNLSKLKGGRNGGK